MSYPSGMGTQIINGLDISGGQAEKACLRKPEMDSAKNLRQQTEKLADKKTPLNLVVSEAGINEDVTIKSFEYKPFGGHGDYSYVDIFCSILSR